MAVADHRLPAEADDPGVGVYEPGDDAEQRGLAAARRSEHSSEVALGHLEIDAGEDLLVTEALDDALDRHAGHENTGSAGRRLSR